MSRTCDRDDTGGPEEGREVSQITASAMRRTLARARDGKSLDQDEATVLLHARGDDLRTLLTYASRTRDAGLEAAGGPKTITYSRKVFIPLTRLCRDRCGYCTFATVPHRLDSLYLEPDEVLDDRPRRRRARLQGGPVHPGRQAGRPVAPGPRVARRARLRRHAVLRTGHGHPRARGDRPAAAPQPGRAELAGLPAPQAGRPVHGHDARDHGHPPVHRARAARTSAAPTRTPRSGCACWRTPAAATSRSPPASSSASARRWPNGPTRSSPSGRSRASTAASRKSSCRTSGPSRTPRCATCRTPNSMTWPPRSPSPGSCSAPRPASRRRPTWSATSTTSSCGPASTTGAASPR